MSVLTNRPMVPHTSFDKKEGWRARKIVATSDPIMRASSDNKVKIKLLQNINRVAVLANLLENIWF